MSAHPDDFANGRLVRKQPFLDHFPNHQYAPGELNVLVVQVAPITKCVSVGGEKASIGADDGKTWRCLDPIVNGLAF